MLSSISAVCGLIIGSLHQVVTIGSDGSFSAGSSSDGSHQQDGSTAPARSATKDFRSPLDRQRDIGILAGRCLKLPVSPPRIAAQCFGSVPIVYSDGVAPLPARLGRLRNCEVSPRHSCPPRTLRSAGAGRRASASLPFRSDAHLRAARRVHRRWRSGAQASMTRQLAHVFEMALGPAIGSTRRSVQCPAQTASPLSGDNPQPTVKIRRERALLDPQFVGNPSPDVVNAALLCTAPPPFSSNYLAA